MQYFRNVDIVKEHRVDESTVRKWIRNAKNGKLDLTLHEQDGRTYIANTAKNTAAIEELVEAHRKFRNSKAAKVVKPEPEFYKLYTQAQIYDMVTNLELHHEIPRQYNYFDGGASHWNKYAREMVMAEAPNVINSTVKLLDKNRSYIDDLLAQYKRVNVVDVGVGNAWPIRAFLERLLEHGTLARYIAIDISAEMLEIARRNLKEWFGDRIAFEGYELDINREQFTNILAEEYLREDAQDTVNLVLLLGGTPYNFRNPDGVFKMIHDSMGVNDFLMHTQKLDSEATRRYFDFNLNPGKPELPPIHRFAVDLLNIDDALYELELGYDETRHQRYERIRLKVALTMRFEFEQGERVVHFGKGESILVWRSWQQTAFDVAQQFDRNDFYILHSSQTKDQEYILTVSRAKAE